MAYYVKMKRTKSWKVLAANLNIIKVDAKDRFLDKLAGVSDP